jgi:hypothetical protein
MYVFHIIFAIYDKYFTNRCKVAGMEKRKRIQYYNIGDDGQNEMKKKKNNNNLNTGRHR